MHRRVIVSLAGAAALAITLVSEEDGRFLRVLIATSKAKRALEIGGASGYSAIWIGMGLRDTGGTLVTMEYDAARNEREELVERG